ncbi:hypothetical protein Pfo_001846, partial [Paulownia fortunei]
NFCFIPKNKNQTIFFYFLFFPPYILFEFLVWIFLIFLLFSFSFSSSSSFLNHYHPLLTPIWRRPPTPSQSRIQHPAHLPTQGHHPAPPAPAHDNNTLQPSPCNSINYMHLDINTYIHIVLLLKQEKTQKFLY